MKSQASRGGRSRGPGAQLISDGSFGKKAQEGGEGKSIATVTSHMGNAQLVAPESNRPQEKSPPTAYGAAWEGPDLYDAFRRDASAAVNKPLQVAGGIIKKQQDKNPLPGGQVDYGLEDRIKDFGMAMLTGHRYGA